MRKLISFFCSVLVALSALPAYAVEPPAKPVIVEIGAQQVSAAKPVDLPFHIYLPFAGNPKCYSLTPLSPGASSTSACAALDTYAGSQGLRNYVETVTAGETQLYQSDMPSHVVSIPRQAVTIHPQTGNFSALKTTVSSMTLLPNVITDGGVEAANVNPLQAWLAWTLKYAMDKDTASNPALFPVLISTMHYAEPREDATQFPLGVACAPNLNAGQLTVNGYVTDLRADDFTTAAGNIWLRMKYFQCPMLTGYWIHMKDWRTGLRSDSRYPVWLGQANALVGNTYHVQVEYMDESGSTVTIPSTVVIVVVGLIILTFVVPEITLPEAGVWMMTGALVPN